MSGETTRDAASEVDALVSDVGDDDSFEEELLEEEELPEEDIAGQVPNASDVTNARDHNDRDDNYDDDDDFLFEIDMTEEIELPPADRNRVPWSPTRSRKCTPPPANSRR